MTGITGTKIRENRRRLALRRESGQAVIEFALVLPLLALMIAGIVQFGIAYNHYITITDATRAGARVGAVTRSESSCVTAVRDSAGSLSVTPTCTSSWTAGSQLTVTATTPYSINLVGIVVKSGDLTSTTKERVE